jgi:hypothetical protein
MYCVSFSKDLYCPNIPYIFFALLTFTKKSFYEEDFTVELCAPRADIIGLGATGCDR